MGNSGRSPLSSDLSVGIAAAYAGITQIMGAQEISISVMKTQLESQQAIAGMLMEQAAQLRALTYNGKGQAVQPIPPGIDTRV